MTVSTMHHGEYGLDDISLSTIAIVGPTGVSGKLLAPLNDHETELLHKSADSLRNVMNNVQF